jgi:2-polyprenyl-3-methyl-5-hydroxy-6-metoxy-1,4-benzoquinol methylase
MMLSSVLWDDNMDIQSDLPEIALHHESANAIVKKLPSGKYKISTHKLDPNYFINWDTCETSYLIELIEKIFKAKGPGWLCDKIARDESPEYTGAALKLKLFSYLSEDNFNNKRFLDLGCGSGASTVHLAQLLPLTAIVGVELEEELVTIAKTRAAFYGLNNTDFFHTTSPDNIPNDLGKFDFISMIGVFEHLLPNERINLMPQPWFILKPGGVLFLHETTHR